MTYSVIIVLGNWMDQSGCLQVDSVARMDLALKAFRENNASVLVTSGWAYREDSDIAIADAMKEYAVKIGGLAPELILAERSSRDTVGDAVFTKRNVVSCGDENINWMKLLVVTSDYHVQRVAEIFRFVYGERYEIEVLGAKSVETDPASEGASVMAFRKTFTGIEPGDDSSIYKRLSEEHPFYNGTVHPQI